MAELRRFWLGLAPWLVVAVLAVVLAIGVAARGPAEHGPESASCLPLDQMHVTLAGRYGERVLFAGRDDAGGGVALYRGRSGSWTVISVTSDGWSCLVAAGTRGRLAGEE